MTTWRTATVVELCVSMREAQDCSAAPILADALQDADYPHDEELAQLRDPHVARWLVEMLIAQIYSAETAAAVGWLQEFAKRVGYTYEKVVDGTRVYAATGDQYAGGAGYNFDDPDYAAAWTAQSAFNSKDPADWEPDPELLNEFFSAYELVTGTRVEAHHRGESPFTCPC